MPIPQDWDELLATWDQALAVWDPAPPGAVFAGELDATGTLAGNLVLGVVPLEGPLTGTGTLAGSLAGGVFLAGALDGVGTLEADLDLQIGVFLEGDLVGTGTLVGVFAIPPAGAELAGALEGTGTLTGILPGLTGLLVIPHLFGDDTPHSLTPQLDENFDAITTAVNAAALVGIGTLAARPAPLQSGAIYVVTDQNDEWFIVDNGGWQSMGAFGLDLVVHHAGNLLLLGAAAAGAGAQGVLAIQRATTRPTTTPVDSATLYVADLQGQAGHATLHQLSEDGLLTPLDPVLFRSGAVTLPSDTGAHSLFAAGPPTVQGGTLVGRSLEVWWRGVVTTPTGGQELTLRLTYGGTVLLLAVVPISATGEGHICTMLDGLRGPVQWAIPQMLQGASGGIGAAVYTVTAGAADSTVDQPLDLTAQWTTAAFTPGPTVATHALTVTLR